MTAELVKKARSTFEFDANGKIAFELVSTNFEWDRSFSETDLTDPNRLLSRFTIKNLHEYISVDDLKFFRRKRPPDLHTRSSIGLQNCDEPGLPFGALKSEYMRQFVDRDGFNLRPGLLRRSTSLHLEGLMHHESEQQAQYHWYTPQDCQSCRSYPIRNPETFCLGGGSTMEPEYRSSYICYPMVDRTMKILPREMFRIEPDATTADHAQQQQAEKNLERSPAEEAAINKLAEDKFKRDVAAQEQQKCHLQQRANETHYNAAPSEYMRQYVRFPIEKAHSIPQISHFKMQGDFVGVPEYQDSFKMYANYSKSAPIKKIDNLRMSGAEQLQPSRATVDTEVPEYREKYSDPSKNVSKNKSLKTADHLYPRGEFSKDLPEYHESFRDPQLKQMPERGKSRESYLRLKGKLEFNPEYRNTYLDFPRSRPICRKPTSSLRLPISSTTTTTPTADSKTPYQSPRRKFKSSSPNRIAAATTATATDLTTTPEYRRANYNYQLRERTPVRKVNNSTTANSTTTTVTTRKNSDSSMDAIGKIASTHKRRPSRQRQHAAVLDAPAMKAPVAVAPTFDSIAGRSNKKPAKFGRRATVKYDCENRDSFVVLKEPCKRSNWMKKSWYES